MRTAQSPTPPRRRLDAPALAGLLVAVEGCAVLLGWLTGLSALKSVSPQWVTMKPNTASCFVLAGAALAGLRLGAPRSRLRSLAPALAGTAALVGALTLAEYALQRSLGLDQFLFRETQGARETFSPGRMSPATAFCFILLGLALLGLARRTPSGRRTAQLLALAGLTIGVLDLSGYLYGVESLYAFSPFSSMAIHTALGFVVLSSGLLLATGEVGPLRILLGDGLGKTLARRLLPFAVALPLALGRLCLQGERRGFYGFDFGLALFAVSNVLTFGVLIWSTAASLNRTDAVRKRAEAALLESLREVTQLRTALDEHAIVAVTNPKGEITYVNDRFCTISKYGRHELLGRDHRLINSGHHSKEFIRDIWTTIAGGRVWHGEIRNRAKDGSLYWVDTTIVPFLDDQGRPRQYVAIRADISERKRAEESLLEARDQLEQRVIARTAELAEATRRAEAANAAKSAFLANMSHELRTPLNGVIGISSFLATGKPGTLSPKQQDYVADIHNSGRHLLQLVNDILDLSKVEAGRMESFPESFFLPRAVSEVTATLMPEAERKAIALTTRFAPNVGHVTLDLQKFKQVLLNLLSNAVKFTEPGGRVEVVADRSGERLRLQVSDTGIGIRREDISRLFMPFQQLDSGPSRRFEGTGLGLALSRKIVEFQGGTISVQSEHGRGSTFTVELPCPSMEQASLP